jgi:hypothetical protein
MKRVVNAEILLCVLAWLVALSFSPVGAELEVGPLTTPRLPSALIDYTQVAEGLHSSAFVKNMRGIAFGAIAKPKSATSVFMNLDYDPTKPDGQRVVVTIREDMEAEQVVHVSELYDWQLLPIVEFATEDQHAVLTLSGSLEDEKQTELHRQQGDLIVNYHPRFQGTLLGLRLVQADRLISTEDFLKITRESRLQDNGGPISPTVPRELAATFEAAPNDLLARCCSPLGAQQIDKILAPGEVLASPKENFQAYSGVIQDILPEVNRVGFLRSYVITDYGQSVEFSAADGKLVLTGYPIWYCWRLQLDDDPLLQELSHKIRQETKDYVEREYRWDQRKLKAKDLKKKYSHTYIVKRQEQVYKDLLRDELERLQGIVPMPGLSARLSEAIRRYDVNPPVYNALVNVMRYAAFFRYAKIHAADAYASFLGKVRKTDTMLLVTTPTVIPRPR